LQKKESKHFIKKKCLLNKKRHLFKHLFKIITT
jgi:hypothetical protein